MGIVTTLTVSTRQATISTTLDTDSPPATFMNKDRKSIALSTACNGQNDAEQPRVSFKLATGMAKRNQTQDLSRAILTPWHPLPYNMFLLGGEWSTKRREDVLHTKRETIVSPFRFSGK